MREWVELVDEPRPSFLKFWPFLSCYLWSFVGVSSCWPGSSKSHVHCEVEVHTACVPEAIKNTEKGLHPTQHIPTCFACLF